MTKENLQAIEYIQEVLMIAQLLGVAPSVSSEKLESLGVNTEPDRIGFRNLILMRELLFPERFTIRIINEERDWNNVPISNSKPLLTTVKRILGEGRSTISRADFLRLNIHPKKPVYKLENIELRSLSYSWGYSICEAG